MPRLRRQLLVYSCFLLVVSVSSSNSHLQDCLNSCNQSSSNDSNESAETKCWRLLDSTHCASHCSAVIEESGKQPVFDASCESTLNLYQEHIKCFWQHHLTVEGSCAMFADRISATSDFFAVCRFHEEHVKCLAGWFEFFCGVYSELITINNVRTLFPSLWRSTSKVNFTQEQMSECEELLATTIAPAKQADFEAAEVSDFNQNHEDTAEQSAQSDIDDKDYEVTLRSGKKLARNPGKAQAPTSPSLPNDNVNNNDNVNTSTARKLLPFVIHFVNLFWVISAFRSV